MNNLNLNYLEGLELDCAALLAANLAAAAACDPEIKLSIENAVNGFTS